MSGIMRWWQRMSFWNKVESTLILIGSASVVELANYHAPYWTFMVIGGAMGIGKFLKIWIVDRDGDGKIDPL